MTDNPDAQRQADISDAHHEGFGAGVAWADQTPDTGDGARVIPKSLVAELQRWATLAPEDDWGETMVDTAKADMARWILNQITDDELRQSLTEAEASHQAEMGRAQLRIAELEHTITQYLDSHGTAGTGELGKRLKAAVGRVE